MLYSAVDLSKHIVIKCIHDGCAISNLQLQLILYYIQKDFLHGKDHAAFSDAIEAWPFGPAVPIVYYKFCGFGPKPITIPFEESGSGIDIIDLTSIDEVLVKILYFRRGNTFQCCHSA